MDESYNQNPSEIDRYHLNKALHEGVYDLSKKRKLQAEQVILPIPKHKCWDHRIIYRPLSVLEENQESDDLIVHMIQENVERQIIEDGSDPESVKDSNSFVGDSDSVMSVHGEAKSETEMSKQWPCIGPSTSSLEGVAESRGIDKDEMAFMAEQPDPYYHYKELHQNVVDGHITEFESSSEYICSEHGVESTEPYTDNDLEEVLNSNAENSNMYILSSGRWSANQDAQTGTRNPTIDQEFEQYFSMLML